MLTYFVQQCGFERWLPVFVCLSVCLLSLSLCVRLSLIYTLFFTSRHWAGIWQGPYGLFVQSRC